MYDVTGKTALITGGTRGIGLEIARQLLTKGANVAVNGRTSTDEAEALRAEFGPDRVSIALADVASPDAATALVADAGRAFGRLDMLIHSAGGPVPGTALTLTTDAWMDAFALHVHPVFHLFRAAHPFLMREGGAVLLVSSVAALRGCPNSVAYQTVKGALIPMAKALAFDNAAAGIRVNVIAPGIIRTRFHANMSEAQKKLNLEQRIPLHREGTPAQVASLITELVTNDYLTGETFTIDGGLTMRIA